ncbi:hypothetical protein TNCV_4649411 [Trichonephila clavipes]|uniref:Uncharacterized protein n=1 Tax=Trichonephila clavipes TaxID=2585209 RepID=A0A8X6SX43_TRICX|nr:hypothetical protein TNCV_4649411 [Trichonephila clavipes]
MDFRSIFDPPETMTHLPSILSVDLKELIKKRTRINDDDIVCMTGPNQTKSGPDDCSGNLFNIIHKRFVDENTTPISCRAATIAGQLKIGAGVSSVSVNNYHNSCMFF